MLVIPAIDLQSGRCVRLTQGRRNSTRVYDGDPVHIAKSYEASGAGMLHVVDLDGAFSDSNSANRRTVYEIVRAIQTPVQFGGGIRNVAEVRDLIEFGVARVVLGTVAVEAPQTLRELLRIFGRDRIVVGIDAKAGRVVTRGWEKDEALTAVHFAVQLASLGVDRIIYTDVERDGMLTGVNIDATCKLARSSGLKVTASGGVSSLDDIERVARASCGIDSVIVGKALYEGHFTFQEALLAGKQDQAAFEL